MKTVGAVLCLCQSSVVFHLPYISASPLKFRSDLWVPDSCTWPELQRCLASPAGSRAQVKERDSQNQSPCMSPPSPPLAPVHHPGHGQNAQTTGTGTVMVQLECSTSWKTNNFVGWSHLEGQRWDRRSAAAKARRVDRGQVRRRQGLS